MKHRQRIASVMAIAFGFAPTFVVAPNASAAATFISARYEMNEPAGSTVLIDSSGNGLNGTIGVVGNPAVSVAGYTFDDAIAHRFPDRKPNLPPAEPQRLDTAPSYSAENPDSQDFAISVRYRTDKPFGNLVQKGQNGSVGGYYKIELPNGRPTCLFKGIQNGVVVQRAVKAPLGYELKDNLWHTIKCERLQTRVALWIDGVEVNRVVGWSGNISNNKNLSIAGKLTCDQVNTTCDYFVGDIDWVQIDKGSSGPIDPSPTASFTSTCTQLTCTFNGSASSDPGGSIISYAWEFGDGTKAAGRKVTHAYAASGTYVVRLTVTDNNNSTGTTTQQTVATAP